MKKILGALLILLGILALLTPFTPGSWLIFVGLGMLGIRVGFWEDLINRIPMLKKWKTKDDKINTQPPVPKD